MIAIADDPHLDVAVLDPEDFALRLRELRARAGVSQSELARRSGLPQSNISAWESGHNTPLATVLPTLAAALDCDVREFFTLPIRTPPKPQRGRPPKKKAEE